MRFQRPDVVDSRSLHGDQTRGLAAPPGFTLVEFLVTLAVTAILFSVTVPNFRTFVQNNRLAGATSDFVTAINQARTEALKRGVRVYLCRTGNPHDEDGPACGADLPNGDANADKDWTPGWFTYALPIDFNPGSGASDYDEDAGDELITIAPAAAADLTVTANTLGDRRFGFLADGTLHASGTVRYTICDDRDGAGDTGRLFEIAPIGRVVISRTDDCTPEG